jgi:hypothetical protein
MKKKKPPKPKPQTLDCYGVELSAQKGKISLPIHIPEPEMKGLGDLGKW